MKINFYYVDNISIPFLAAVRIGFFSSSQARHKNKTFTFDDFGQSVQSSDFHHISVSVMKSASASGLRKASPTRSTREESTFSAKLQVCNLTDRIGDKTWDLGYITTSLDVRSLGDELRVMQVCIVKQEIKKMRQEGRLGANGSASAAGLIVPKKRLVCYLSKDHF